MPPVKAPRRFEIRLTGDSERLEMLREDEWHHIHYLMRRLLSGEPIAASELEHFGMSLDVADCRDVQPAASDG